MGNGDSDETIIRSGFWSFFLGRKIKFIGEGSSLLGKFLFWYFLTIITLGIYGLWMVNNFEKFKADNTVFLD